MSILSASVRWLKSRLYFAIAYYFRFFAKIQLKQWQPRIIVITGSSGKTTLLQLIDSQLKEKARYSHRANSAFGIPFDILGLHRTSYQIGEWLYLFILAPFCAFKKKHAEKIYIVEADVDRPGEGKFLASLLTPEVVLWTNTGLTHSVNFDPLIAQGKFTKVTDAIAFEFGYFLEYAKQLVIINGDEAAEYAQTKRATVAVQSVSLATLAHYTVDPHGTTFTTAQKIFSLPYVLPKEFFYSLMMTQKLLHYLQLPFDTSLQSFSAAPGRSTLFAGIKGTSIIDSSYNATPDGMAAILAMMIDFTASSKWLVLGDMIELGQEEQQAHERLAEQVAFVGASQIVLVGSRVTKYTYPKLLTILPSTDSVVCFEQPKDALIYLRNNLVGGETILFKGARFLEGIIEQLLANPAEANKLCRREFVWQNRREQWGL